MIVGTFIRWLVAVLLAVLCLGLLADGRWAGFLAAALGVGFIAPVPGRSWGGFLGIDSGAFQVLIGLALVLVALRHDLFPSGGAGMPAAAVEATAASGRVAGAAGCWGTRSPAGTDCPAGPTKRA